MHCPHLEVARLQRQVDVLRAERRLPRVAAELERVLDELAQPQFHLRQQLAHARVAQRGDARALRHHAQRLRPQQAHCLLAKVQIRE